MKTYFKYILAPSVFAFALYSCSDLATPGSDTEESINATYNNEQARLATDDPALRARECDYTGRQAVRQYRHEKGVVKRIMRGKTEREGFTFAIHMPSSNRNFMACGLADDLRRDGMWILVSGEEMQIRDGEKWAAMPFMVKEASRIHAPGPVSGPEKTKRP